MPRLLMYGRYEISIEWGGLIRNSEGECIGDMKSNGPICDRRGNVIGQVSGGTILDASGNLMAYISKGKLYDHVGQVLGEINVERKGCFLGLIEGGVIAIFAVAPGAGLAVAALWVLIFGRGPRELDGALAFFSMPRTYSFGEIWFAFSIYVGIPFGIIGAVIYTFMHRNDLERGPSGSSYQSWPSSTSHTSSGGGTPTRPGRPRRKVPPQAPLTRTA